MWLWPDLSASMGFRSHLSKVMKRDRAIVLALAAAELLVRSGERVGLLGVTPPYASRRVTTRLAEALASHWDQPQLSSGRKPSDARLSRFSGVVLFSDFLDPIEEITASLSRSRPMA